MWLQGGLTHRHDIRPFYLRLLNMIDGLPDGDQDPSGKGGQR